MARKQELKVVISGDAKQLNRVLSSADKGLDKLGKQTRVTSTLTSKGFAGMRIAAVGAAGAFGGLAIAGRSVVNAAVEAEKSQARLQAQLKASDISYRAHAKEIDAVIQRHSRLAGLDDEDLQDAFTSIIRTTGNVSKSLRLVGLASDFARGRQIDVAKAGDIVAKVAGGNVGVLGRYGVKLREGASASEALAALQRKFAGQAEAYGRTNAGAADRAAVAYENLKETLGNALAPVVGNLSNRFARFVTQMQTGTGEGGRFAATLKDIWEGVRPILGGFARAATAIGRFSARHPEVTKLAGAVLGVGVAVKTLKFVSAATGFTDMLKVGGSTMKRLRRIFIGEGAAAGAAAGTAAAGGEGLAGKGGLFARAGRRFGGLLRKPMVTAGATAGAAAGTAAAGGEGLTSGGNLRRGQSAGRRLGGRMGKGMIIGLAAGALAIAPTVSDVIVKAYGRVFQAAKKLGATLGRGLVSGLKSIPGGIVGGIKDAIGNIFGDAIGKIPAAPRVGRGSAALQGANSALAPIAGLGARLGLRVSSGLRPGARTSSGNQSYHSTGEAVDLAGPPAAMGRAFRAIKSTFGPRLAELIYTPGGVGVRNGRPHRYSGQVAADHYDHIHAALDLGRPGPGIGDGPGRRKPGTGDGDGVVGAFRRAIRRTGAGPKASLALFEAGIVESGLRNLNYGDRDSIGALQVRVGIHGRSLAADPYASAIAFLTRGFTGRGGAIALARRFPQATAGQIAQMVQGSAFPGRYDQVRGRAARYVGGARGTGGASARGGGAPVRSSAGSTAERVNPYEAQVADADLAIAEAESGGTRRIGSRRVNQQTRMLGALTTKRGVVSARIKRVRRALRKRGLSRAKRLALTQELTQLLGDYTALGGQINEIRNPEREAADTDTGDIGAPDVPDMPDPAEVQSNLISENLSDLDLRERAGVLTPEQVRAMKLSNIEQWLAGALGPLQERQRLELMAAQRELQEQTNQTQADLAEAVRGLKESIDAQTAFAGQVSAITSMQAVRFMADRLTGELGARVGARGHMPGDGTLSRL
jgi:hypothetical protein